MKYYYPVYLTMLISIPLYAQIDQTLNKTSADITDILTTPTLQTDIYAAKETSKLEDLLNINECAQGDEIETDVSCQGFANALIPQDYKNKGWKTLLEIKYQPVNQKAGRSFSRASYNALNFDSYRYATDKEEKNITTSRELDEETRQIQDWYLTSFGTTINAFDIRTQLILDQLKNPAFTKNDTDMMDKIRNYSATMNDQEFTRFVSSIADYVDYNHQRSSFKQTPGGGQGVSTPFQQITGTKLGICGDIHSMAAKVAEQRGWEAFTVGYAIEGMQHVATAMVNPNDPKKIMIVNYGRYEEQMLNDGNSISAAPSTPGWEEIGTQLRIFKNKKTGDPLGKMEQIATVPTALGSFMGDLFKKEYQIAKAMPANQRFRKEQVGSQYSRQKTTLKDSGKEVTSKLVSNGVIVYEGQTDNAEIFGIAVSHDVYKDLYRWDAKKGKCVLKQNKYFSLGVAGSLVDLTQAKFEDTFYAYLNIKGGKIFHIYQSEYFQFKGMLGYEFDGFLATYDQGFLTADGNFATFLGLAADYNKNGTSVHLGINLEGKVALRNQNLMTDLSSIPKNVNPIAFNALSLEANVFKKLNPQLSFVSNNNLSMSKVGGRVFLSTGLIQNNTSISLAYDGIVRPIPIGNTLQTVNLLQNFNNMDGVRISVSQNFKGKKTGVSGTISAYGGISTTQEKDKGMAGASLKLKIDGKKRTPTSKK